MTSIQRSNFQRKTGLALAATGLVQQTFSHRNSIAAETKHAIGHGNYIKVKQMHQDFRIYNHSHDDCADKDNSLIICQWNATKSDPIKLKRV